MKIVDANPVDIVFSILIGMKSQGLEKRNLVDQDENH